MFCVESKSEEAGKERSAEAAEIAEYILANCNDRKIIDWMRVDICYYYYWAGNKEKALECADELPSAAKNTVKEFLLADNEKMVLCQKNIILHLQELCYSLLTRADLNCENDPQLKDTDRIKILNKIVDVSEAIFENEDYNFHYRLISLVYTHIAAVAVRSKDYDEAFKNLIKALNFAIAADELPERKPYTSLAVNKLVYDMYDISVSSPTLCCKELLGYLNWSVFDDIRDTEKFQNIYLKAKEHCDK